jgi:hypothetical protein
MDPEMEQHPQAQPPMMAALVRLCPNAKLPTDFDGLNDRHQCHFIVSDTNAEKAARLTLQAYGDDVTEVASHGPNLHLWFEDETQGERALNFYQRLPQRLAGFTTEQAAALKRRIDRLQPSGGGA